MALNLFFFRKIKKKIFPLSSPHTTKQQLYGHLPPITKTIKVRRSRHAAHLWRSRDERPGRTYIQHLCADTGKKTFRERWTIEKGGGRGSGRSAPAARHHDLFN